MNTVLFNDIPVTPSKIVCVGRNYVEHIEELNNEIPQEMVIFLKPNSAISPNLKAYDGETLHYESEICFLVYHQELAGIGFGIDLTKRNLQTQLKTKGLPWERAKAFNGSAVFSPFLEIKDSMANYALELKINDQYRQQGSVDLMINKPHQILNEILTFMELNDGDIIMTGTPKGVGMINPGENFHGKVYLEESTFAEASWKAE